MSLRLRLFLMGAVVALVAAASVGLFARGRVEGEFRQVLEHDDRVAFDRIASDAQARLARGEPRDEVARAFTRAADEQRRPLAWLAADGTTFARSRSLAGARITSDARGQVFVSRGSENFVWIGLPHVVLRDAAGTLWMLPSMSGPARLTSGIHRALFHAALFGLLAAIALSLVLGRALAGSLEELTAAARAVAAGDRKTRVVVRGSDEIATLGASFNTLVESIERGETLRKNLVADVAHELRTPVTNLKAHLEALEDGLVAPTPEAIASLREETDRLARLIGDLQDFALAEAGALQLERAPVDLAALLNAAADAARPRASARGVALVVEGAGEAQGDRARLAQVLANLLDNALTHTPEGGTVTLEAAGSALRVSDTGEGIAPEHLPFVFERFYRADPSRARATGGAGLGLALVRRIVEAHGGTIALESTPGRGTSVRIELPS
jgi:signal transduction histidine kinase